MDLFRCVVLTILFTETIGGDFFISEDESDWTTATMQCQLAGPDLIFAHDGKISVNIPVDIKGDVWVGYYQARTAFEYLGCARKPDDRPMFKTEQEDPGLCMSACGAIKRIGVFKTECFCIENEIENDVDTKFPNCTGECSGISGIVCGGGSRRNRYISLYRSIGGMEYANISSIGGLGIDSCVYYDHSGFHWNNCSTNNAFVCGTTSTVWIENNNINQPVYGKWADATVKCFANNTRPSTYNNTQSLKTTTSTAPLWTGIVRSQVIYKYTTDTSHMDHANKYGFLNHKKELILTDESDGITRKSICVKVTDTTATPSSSVTSSSSKAPLSSETPSSSETHSLSEAPSSSETPSSSEAPSSSEIPSSTETSASMSSLTTAKANDINSTEPLKVEGGSSDVGAIVGATLSIAVVIVVVVVAVMFLRKRGFQLPFLKKEKQAPSTSMIQNNKSHAISRPVEILQSTYHTDNEEYAEIDLTTTLDNEAKNGKLNDAPGSSDYAHNYVVLEKPDEEQYDSTKPKDKKSEPNTYNPYNTLSFEESSNYDHVDAGKAKAGTADRKVSESENTYNTTSLGNSYLKTSGCESNNAYSMAEETEDTYNHTNVRRHQMGLKSSENDYDAI